MSDIRVYLIGGPADGSVVTVSGGRPAFAIYMPVPVTPVDTTIEQVMYEVRRMGLFGHCLFVGVPTGSTLEDNVKALFPAELAELILEGPVLR